MREMSITASLVALSVAYLLAGCTSRDWYREPSRSEPHATIKFPADSDRYLDGGEHAYVINVNGTSNPAEGDKLRVHPGEVALDVVNKRWDQLAMGQDRHRCTLTFSAENSFPWCAGSSTDACAASGAPMPGRR